MAPLSGDLARQLRFHFMPYSSYCTSAVMGSNTQMRRPLPMLLAPTAYFHPFPQSTGCSLCRPPVPSIDTVHNGGLWQVPQPRIHHRVGNQAQPPVNRVLPISRILPPPHPPVVRQRATMMLTHENKENAVKAPLYRASQPPMTVGGADGTSGTWRPSRWTGVLAFRLVS